MMTRKNAVAAALIGIGIAALLASAQAAEPLKIDFSEEAVGAESKIIRQCCGCMAHRGGRQ